MRSSIYNVHEYCYIAPVLLIKTERINVCCEGFVIKETHEVYTFIL